jgi:hypothetical protein
MLLLLAAAAMVLQLGSVAHLHFARDSGVYNQEHDLTLLAGLAGHVIQVDGAPAITFDAVSTALIPFTPERPALRLARSGDSRAPPAS